MWLTLAHLRRLRGRLHGDPEARDAAEHRDRRRVGRDAAGAGLGRGHRRRRARGAAAVPDHLRLDAAAFLVARALPHARTTRKAGLPMLPVTHGAHYTRLHDLLYTLIAVRGDAAAVRDPHERLALPRRGAGARRGCSSATRCALPPLQRRARARARSATRSSTSRRCSRRCWSTTTGADAARRAACCAARRGRRRDPARGCVLAGCGQRAEVQGLRRHRHAVRPRLRADRRTTASRARSPISAARSVVLFFGYTHCPDVCPTTLADLAEVMKQLGPDAARVQVLFVTVDPGARHAELLAQYVPAFDPRFLGLCGDAAATARDGEGIQDLLPEAAGRDAGNLHDGPFGGDVRVRPAGTAARVRELRPGAGRVRARHARAAAQRPAEAARGAIGAVPAASVGAIVSISSIL